MNRRLRILLALFALSWLVALLIFYSEFDVPRRQLPSFIFMGLLLLAAALVLLSGKGRRFLEGGFRSLKPLFAASALVFACWMLASLVAIPFVGYAGFKLIDQPWFPAATSILAVILFPVTRRYMR